jgi:hypothetical protein
MECGSAKRTRLAAIEAAKEAHVYPVTLEPGQVTVTEQLIFAEACAKEVFSAERARMMTAQETALVNLRAEEIADKIAADQTTLAEANRRRAEENADMIAADQATLAAANRRRADETADKIAADQTKINCASSLCGAEGCGKRNIGQFESTTAAAMRQHCATKKHTVLDYAQNFALLLCLPKFIATSYTRKICCLQWANRKLIRKLKQQRNVKHETHLLTLEPCRRKLQHLYHTTK